MQGKCDEGGVRGRVCVCGEGRGVDQKHLSDVLPRSVFNLLVQV